jgi:hypothetical protein
MAFKNLADSTAISAGECHNAVGRLRLAQLILADERRPSLDALHEFLLHGAAYAFPPILGALLPGVPTAHASTAFSGIVESADIHVWPHAEGSARGQSLVPLYPGATALPALNRPLYELLTIVDALRVGTTRVRTVAGELLRVRLGGAIR